MMSSLFLFMIYYIINKILILSVHIDFTTASFMVPPHTLAIRYKSLLKFKADNRVSSVELSVVFSVEKMSVEKNMTLNSTINNTKFF